MTWIKTIPLAEADQKLREAIEGERALYPREYAQPTGITDEAGGIVASHTLIPDALLSRLRDLRRADVAGSAADAPAARDDRDDGLGHQQVPLLNRVPRRVSASGHPG